jgi:Farnesoic acid 0-methyl transferase
MRWLPLVFLLACKVKDPPPIKDEWTDNFERDKIGDSYYATGKGYRVAKGALNAKGAHNHPLWLRAKLPHDVRVELVAWSTEDRGDIKIEIFGDGHSYDPDGGQYMATGYELIFGGWYNSKSIIARMDEHAPDVVQRVQPKVVPNQKYQWRIERRANTLTWYIDDMTRPFLQLVDPRPLEGTGHDYLGFNNWETDTWFDNLVITPL